MIEISYSAMVLIVSVLWVIVRAAFCIRQRKVDLRREAQLLLVYQILILFQCIPKTIPVCR